MTALTPHGVYLGLSRVEDAGFETVGELVPTRQQLAVAVAYDDQEQPLIARIYDLVSACTCGAGEIALPLIRHREALDKAERSAIESAQEHAGAATQFARTANGLLERALVGFRALLELGRWSKSGEAS